jgi:hypothetical protein
MVRTQSGNISLSNDGYTPGKVGRDVFAYALGYYQNDYKQ